MAGKQIVQKITYSFDGEISGLQRSVEKMQTTIENLQKSTGKVQLPTSTANTFNKDLDVLLVKLKELQAKNKDGKIDIGDAKEINRISKKISEIFAGLQTEMKNLGNLSEKLLPPEVLKRFKDLEKSIDSRKQAIKAESSTEASLIRKRNSASNKGVQLQNEINKKNAGKVIKDEEYNALSAFNKSANERKKIEDRIKKENDGKLDKRKYTKEDKAAISEYEQLEQAIKKLGYSATDVKKVLKNFTSEAKISKLQNEFEITNKQVEELENNLNKIKSESGSLNLKELKKQANTTLGIDVNGVNSVEELQNKIDKFKTTKINEARQEFDGLNGEIQEGAQKAENLDKKVTQEMNDIVDSTKRASDEFNQFTSRLQYFFGMSNGIQLFKRTLREAYQSIKELDAAMLKIAVVSEYDMSDMWSTLPQFTKQANELGVAITEVYDATGLYVQQGLDLVESQGLANETLKMAKIAGMDAAAATDAMTSALRGFNMELNQGSAEKVNDIYSKLAAITASDTQEIATAMSKTASIANNAGASIENTSAFLSMIIETTRESAETAGTALKTVIARFSELKKNPAEIGDVDGEIVDANQIESALKLAGVDLRDAAGQFRNFDEVIIELSGKWDGLDKNTQRYIATMAAGSRQQSRFLALMSDSERLAQLTDAAYNSTGASTKQFNKTLDSLESKMNQLKNAWNTFTQSLMNNELIKFGVDLLTGILTAINGITNGFAELGSVLGTVLSVSVIAAFFLVAKKGVDGLLVKMTAKMKEAGRQVDQQIAQGIQENQGSETAAADKGIKVGRKFVENAERETNGFFQRLETKIQKIKDGITLTNKKQEKGKNKKNNKKNNKQKANKQSKKIKSKEDNTKTTEDNTKVTEQNTDATKQEAKATQQANQQEQANTDKKQQNSQASQQNTSATDKNTQAKQSNFTATQKLGAAFMALGFATSLVAQKLRENGMEEAAEGAEKLGAGITALGSMFMLLIPITQMVDKAMLKSMGKWILIIMAIAAIVAVAIKIADQISKASPEGKLKSLQEQTEKATEAAQKAQQAYSDWLSDKNEYNGILETIKELTKGTTAWTEEMEKLQDKVYEMINTYPDLAQYVQSDGTFTEEGLRAYDEKLKKQKEYHMGEKLIAQMNEDAQAYQNETNDLLKEREEELSKLIRGTTEYNNKEAYYTQKLKGIKAKYLGSTAGTMNYMAQTAGVEGYIADNVSEVLADHKYQEGLSNQAAANFESGYADYQSADNWNTYGTAGAAAAGGITAGIIAGIAGGPIGWIALAGAAVAGLITYFVTAAEEAEELEELQEAYAEAFGIPVEEIDENIKEDAEALARSVANLNAYKEFQKKVATMEAEILSLGGKAQLLLAEDLSLLDQDFSEYGGFEKYIESLKDGVSFLSDEVIDNGLEKFREKTKETIDSINRIFDGKVKFKYQITNEKIVENETSGLIMSGVDGGQLAAAEKSLRETFGDNTTNALNSVMQSYADNQISVNELTGAYIELGNAATITQKAVAAKKMFETGTKNIKTLAATFMVAEANTLSATNQIKEFYMNLSADQMNEIFKNGMTTAQSIMEMGASFTDLNGIIDTTGINFATLSDVLNDVKSGILSVEDLTQGFVETLDKLNKAEHIVEDVMARIATFQEPTSGRTIGEKFGEVSQKLSDLILEGRYGDPALEAYFDFMFGEDAWNNALKDAEYDAEKAMSKYVGIIQNLSEDVKFFDVWKQTAGRSEGLWSVDGNTINFNFGVASSYEDLVSRIEKVTGWSQQFIESALADAQVWSKDLKGVIQQLTQADALNTYLNNLDAVNGKVNLDREQLEKIFEDMSDEVKKNFGYSYDAFEADVAKKLTGAGYTVQTSANQNLSVDQKVSDIFAKAIEEGKENYRVTVGGGVLRNYQISNDGTVTHDGELKVEFFEDLGKEQATQSTLYDLLHQYAITQQDLQENAEYMNSLPALKKAGPLLENIYDALITGETNSDFEFWRGALGQIGPRWASTYNTDVYKEAIVEAVKEYKNSGLTTWEAVEKVKENYGSDAAIDNAVGFDQGDAYDTIKEWFGDGENQIANWLNIGVTEEEAQLIRQADLINQGTIKAMDYLINSGALDVTNLKTDYQKYDTDIDAVKYLNKYGVQKTNTSKVGSGPNANKQWYTAEQLGITGDGKAKAYHLTADEAREMARNALEQIDFDWMHNFNELGEKITRTLDNLSAEYDLAVKTLSKSTAELTQNLAEQYANMEAEAIVSQAKADAAQQRMQGMLAKNSDLTKYTWYEDGMVKINYDAINAAKADGSLTEKVGILLDELVANAEVINENEALQLEVDTKQAEFLEEINNTIIDFENQVYDMVIEAYEEEIDKLEQIDSAINDANSKLIDSIQKSLDRFRQDRENEKTESDIEDKQRRLALLRADTTGANRGAIMSLEKEIGEAQEDYTDTLIDQKISALQEQNEEASAQRQEQIDIANDQLNSAKENGLINEEVARLLSAEGFKGSALEKLWIDNMSKKGLDKDEWDTELRNMEKQFVEYKSADAFKDMFESGINEDLAEKINGAIGNIETTVKNALGGYKVLSQNDIQAIVDGIGSKIPPGGGGNDKPTLQSIFDDSYLKDQVKIHVNTGKWGYGYGDAKEQFLSAAQAAGFSRAEAWEWFQKKYNYTKYATGGLNTQTGPAWLDGTPSKPELVLNATDTQNFLMLKDILSDVMRGGSFTTNQKDGDLNLEIYLNVEQGISSDYDVEQLVTKVKQEIAKVGRERNIQILTKR